MDALLGGWERDVDCEVEQGSASCEVGEEVGNGCTAVREREVDC